MESGRRRGRIDFASLRRIFAGVARLTTHYRRERYGRAGFVFSPRAILRRGLEKGLNNPGGAVAGAGLAEGGDGLPEGRVNFVSARLIG
jgi:hypothetical protein